MVDNNVRIAKWQVKFTDPSGHMACGVTVVCHELGTDSILGISGGGGQVVAAVVTLTGIAGIMAYMADGLDETGKRSA